VIFPVIVALGGCSQNSRSESTDVERTPLSIGVDGVDAGELSSALLVISNVEVLLDGQPVGVSIDRSRADLVQPDQSLGFRFDAPKGTADVEVRMTFDDFGGYTSGASAGELDSRGAVVRFHSRFEDLAHHGGASVHLDLSRSIVATPSAKRVLVPQFDVR
jgi:hypothetical protein